MTAPGTERPARLSVDDLREALRLNSSELIGEVYEIAKQQVESEEKRETIIGSKAVALLSVSGLSLTVAFTFGGLLLQHPEHLQVLGWVSHLVIAAYAIALLCGLLASVLALWSMRVRSDYRGVNAADVFGPELAEADQGVFEPPDQSRPTTVDRISPINSYRRFLAAHYWRIYDNNFEIHEAKAGQVRVGQWLFVAFVFLLMLIGGAMTYALFVVKPQPPPPAPTVVCQPPLMCGERKPDPPPPPKIPSPQQPKPRPPPTRVPSSGRLITGSVAPPARRTPARPKGGN